MKHDDSLRRWCAQLQEDDGVDPRKYFAKRPSRDGRKSHQLCRQAFRVLALAFPGQFAVPELRDLILADVVPGPDPSRLVLQISSPRPLSLREREETLAALSAIKGRLRAEIARAITRRHAPDLSFALIASTGGAT